MGSSKRTTCYMKRCMLYFYLHCYHSLNSFWIPFCMNNHQMNDISLKYMYPSILKIQLMLQSYHHVKLSRKSNGRQFLSKLTLPAILDMRKLPIIHVNVDLPVSGFAHVFCIQNAYKIQVRASFRALNSNYAAQCRV